MTRPHTRSSSNLPKDVVKTLEQFRHPLPAMFGARGHHSVLSQPSEVDPPVRPTVKTKRHGSYCDASSRRITWREHANASHEDIQEWVREGRLLHVRWLCDELSLECSSSNPQVTPEGYIDLGEVRDITVEYRPEGVHWRQNLGKPCTGGILTPEGILPSSFLSYLEDYAV